ASLRGRARPATAADGSCAGRGDVVRSPPVALVDDVPDGHCRVVLRLHGLVSQVAQFGGEPLTQVGLHAGEEAADVLSAVELLVGTPVVSRAGVERPDLQAVDVGAHGVVLTSG